jgi:SAM-dependent methyltransferase
MNNRNNGSDYESLRLDREGQAEAFDAIGNRYDEAFPHKEGQVSAGEWLIRSLPAGSRVLDLGCGTGVPTARQMADAGFEVMGIDLSGGMVKLARQNVTGATFHQLDLADLRPGGPRDLGRFDAVAAFFSLLMLPRAEIPLALLTVRHLLAPGGLFVLSMVEADVDDVAIPFLGNTIRVSGYLAICARICTRSSKRQALKS